MTSQAVAIAPVARSRVRSGLFLGFTTILRKELTEWARGRGAIVIAAVSIAGAIFTTLIPFIAPKGQGPVLSLDPTANVLLGWNGLTAAVVALVATMGLISGERDRGTLAWTMTRPVAPVALLAAKWTAAMLVVGTFGVILPLAVSSGVATIAYGALPDLRTVGVFALLYLALPAFWIGVTVALGTVVKSTGGVAGVGFAILLAPFLVASAAPVLAEFSPTAIGTWALAVATGHAASAITPVAWLAAIAALTAGAFTAFSREEF